MCAYICLSWEILILRMIRIHSEKCIYEVVGNYIVFSVKRHFDAYKENRFVTPTMEAAAKSSGTEKQLGEGQRKIDKSWVPTISHVQKKSTTMPGNRPHCMREQKRESTPLLGNQQAGDNRHTGNSHPMAVHPTTRIGQWRQQGYCNKNKRMTKPAQAASEGS